ncbi:MAG: transporter [Roseburia sp.]
MEKKTDFKALPPKSKLQYIWDYYRWKILVTILLLAAAISLIHHYVTYRDPVLTLIMINSNGYEYADTAPFDQFLDYVDIDSNEYDVEFLSTPYFPEGSTNMGTYTDLEVMGVQIASGSTDIFMGNGSVYMDYLNQGALLDLSTVLPADILEQYADQLIYSTSDGETAPYPCAIEFPHNQWLADHNYYTGSCCVGIFVNSSRTEMGAKFLEFLVEND